MMSFMNNFGPTAYIKYRAGFLLSCWPCVKLKMGHAEWIFTILKMLLDDDVERPTVQRGKQEVCYNDAKLI